MVESKIINPKQVKYAISVEMFNNASSRDIPMGEQHKIERLKNSYIEDMKVLYQKYEDLEKLFSDGVSKNLTKIRNQAKNIAFYIHNLLDPELIVYHDGYKAYLNEFKSIFSFEEDLRKKSPYLKRLTNNIDLINQVKLLGLAC